MTLSPFIFVVLFLLFFALVLLMLSIGFKLVEGQRKSEISRVLRTVEGELAVPETDILNDAEQQKAGRFRLNYAEWPIVGKFEELIRQAGLTWSPMGLLAAMGGFGAAGALLGTFVRIPVFREFSILAFALALGAAPYLYVSMQRRKRIDAFEEQFPEALDFLARSMRAGHAFSVSLEMMAEDSPAPLGQEFRIVYHEQNLGSPLNVALGNLSRRMPLLDVKFFASAVLMQRDTGGNLAEILTKLAYVIRERFRLKGQVRAASAHGRITASILTLLPVVTLLGLTFVAPGYLESMAKDPDGKYLIIGSVVGQVVGYYIMRRIVDIKV